MKQILLPAAILLTLLSGCTRDTGTGEARADTPAAAARSAFTSLTDAEVRYLLDLRERGGLKAATLAYPGSYELTEGGDVKGFSRRMLEALEDVLGVSVDVRPVDRFDDFFTLRGRVPEGVRTDSSITYIPDILREVDLIAFELTDTAWRSRLMTIVPLVPTRILVVNRRGEEIRSFGGLQGKRIVVAENTSHQVFLEETAQRLDVELDIIPLPFGEDRMARVADGRADCTVSDSQAVLREIPGNPDVNVSLALTGVLMNGWAVRGDNGVLASILEKFFTYAGESGILDEALREGYDLSLQQYYSLINYGKDQRLKLTDEEQAYLEELRGRGGINAAIDGETSIYEVDDAGLKKGLHYNLALAAAQTLDVPIRFRQVTFHDFFMKDGEVPDEIKTDPAFSYVPDLLQEVDLYVGTISPLEWRRKFLAFIGIYPTKLVYVTRDNFPKVEREDLKGSVFSLLPNTTYEGWLKSRFDPEDLTILTVDTGDEAVEAVSTGEADITLSDANLALARMADYPEITFYPADDEVDTISWAVEKDNLLLKGILDKTIEYLFRTMVFNDIWIDYYGISFAEYLELISN